jgi:hypothetical protein
VGRKLFGQQDAAYESQRKILSAEWYKSGRASRAFVLGHLMFIIIINMNDIGSAIKECQYYLFADNTLLSVSGNSVRECLEKLNRDLENLSKWLKFNKLKLNESKTYLIITGRQSSI